MFSLPLSLVLNDVNWSTQERISFWLDTVVNNYGALNLLHFNELTLLNVHLVSEEDIDLSLEDRPISPPVEVTTATR